MSPDPDRLPPSLRFLKWLVIILTITMIGGVITVVGLLVTRMPLAQGPVTLPDGLNLPAGLRPQAVTMGSDWIGVVTTDDRILIFRRDGTLRQEIALTADPSPSATKP